MKKSVLLVLATALSFALITNVNAQEMKQSSDQNKEVNDKNQWIDVRLNSENLVSLRADLLKDEKRKKFYLEIVSEKQGTVYATRFFSKKPVYKKYDLSRLPEGNYTFKVSKNFRNIYSKTILNDPKQNEQLAEVQ